MLTFSNAKDLRLSRLAVGDIIRLLGNTVEGDDITKFGKVREPDYITENLLIELANGLVVEIFPSSEKTVVGDSLWVEELDTIKPVDHIRTVHTSNLETDTLEVHELVSTKEMRVTGALAIDNAIEDTAKYIKDLNSTVALTALSAQENTKKIASNTGRIEELEEKGTVTPTTLKAQFDDDDPNNDIYVGDNTAQDKLILQIKRGAGLRKAIFADLSSSEAGCTPILITNPEASNTHSAIKFRAIANDQLDTEYRNQALATKLKTMITGNVVANTEGEGDTMKLNLNVDGKTGIDISGRNQNGNPVGFENQTNIKFGNGLTIKNGDNASEITSSATMVGAGTHFPKWTPTSDETYEARQHEGEHVYHRVNQELYFSDGVKWVRINGADCPVNSEFLGIFDKQQDLLDTAALLEIPFKKNQVTGYVRKADRIHHDVTVGFWFWRWNGDTENPSTDEKKEPGNWLRDDFFMNYGASIPVFGKFAIDSNYVSWKPIVGGDTGFAAVKHRGQIVNWAKQDGDTSGLKSGMYWSDGSGWVAITKGGASVTADMFNALINQSGEVQSMVQGDKVTMSVSYDAVKDKVYNTTEGQKSVFVQSDTVKFVPEGDGYRLDAITQMEAVIGESTEKHAVNKFHLEDPSHVIADGTMFISATKAVKKDGTDVGVLNKLKEGNGVLLTAAADNTVVVSADGFINCDNDGDQKPINRVRLRKNMGVYQDSNKTLLLNGVEGQIGGGGGYNLKNINVVHNSTAASTVTNEGVLTLNIPPAGGGGGIGDNIITVKGKDYDTGNIIEFNTPKVEFDLGFDLEQKPATGGKPAYAYLKHRGLIAHDGIIAQAQQNTHVLSVQGDGVKMTKSGTGNFKVADFTVKTPVWGATSEGASVGKGFDRIELDKDQFALEEEKDSVNNITKVKVRMKHSGANGLTVSGFKTGDTVEHTFPSITQINYRNGFLKQGTTADTLEWHSGVSAKVGTNAPENKAESVERIDVVGDKTFFDIDKDETNNLNTLTLRLEGTAMVPSYNNFLDKYPPSQRSYGFGFTQDRKVVYIADSATDSWQEVARQGLPAQVDLLESRYPESLTDTGATYDENLHKKLDYVFVNKDTVQASTGGLNLRGAGQGFLQNIYGGEGARWVQMFYEAEGDRVFSRSRKSASAWGQWHQVSGLSDSCFSVMVMDNDKYMKEISDQNYKIPYLVYQDNQANILPVGDKGDFQVMRTGKYNINCIAQFTWEDATAETPASTGAAMELHDGTTTIANLVITENVYEPSTKEFHPLRGEFRSITLQRGKTYNIRVALTNAAGTEKEKLQYDPYKNMVSIDPANSKTQTGSRIINTLYRTLGGLSFVQGNEVRTERATDGHVRVYGEKYLTSFKTLTKPKGV